MATLLDPTARGRVILVGAGPGDPGLLTVRAVEALKGADVVVHDGLVDPRVLDIAPPHAQRISVAKKRSHHTVPQEGINALIVGNYLTTLGRSPEEDLQMLADLEMPIGVLSKAI